jgi:hypothetical protein
VRREPSGREQSEIKKHRGGDNENQTGDDQEKQPEDDEIRHCEDESSYDSRDRQCPHQNSGERLSCTAAN